MKSEWQKWKWEARDWVQNHAAPFHMEKECLDTYDHLTKHASGSWDRFRFYEEAEAALYEWDI